MTADISITRVIASLSAASAVWPHTPSGMPASPSREYLEVGPGWCSLVISLMRGLESIGPPFSFSILHVGTDSYGRLSVVFDRYTPDHIELVAAAQEVFARACWKCGSPVTARVTSPSDSIQRPVCMAHLA